MVGSTTRYGALIVDDEADIRMLMRVLIESSGDDLYVSGEASGGAEALACIDRLDPAVVVLDQMMPGMDGLATARSIRTRRPGQPILLCSAYLDERLEAAAVEAGVSAVLPKTQVGTIAAALHRLLEH